MKQLSEKDVPLLNLILDRDPKLAEMLGSRLEVLEAVLAGPGPIVAVVTGPEPGTVPSTDWEVKILDWFRMRHGNHKLSEVRADLKVEPISKPFKKALHKLIASKQIKSTGSQGLGAAYWLG